MTPSSLLFLTSAITYLILGLWVMLNHKNKVQRLYGVLCLMTCLWQVIWVALFSKLEPQLLYFWLKVGYTGIIFIPPVFYYFITEFTNEEKDRRLLNIIYGVSCLLALSAWIGPSFINGFNHHSWGLSAKAGFLHPFFVIIVSLAVVRMLMLLYAMRRNPELSQLKRRQAGWVLAAVFIYSGGALDLASNYGIPIFPLSFLFTGVALLLFSYAIFRYEFLAITLPSETPEERRQRLAASAEMAQLGVTAAFPLVSEGELLGFLLLGEKRSKEAYDKEDLLLLRIVANQAALAYQRVRYLEMAVRGARTEMLGQIAGGFAHEIKTPLANISIPAELSYIDLTDLEEGKRQLEDVLPELKQRMKEIMTQAFKASDKIEAIRQFSKPGQIDLGPVEITKVIQGSLSLLDHLLHQSHIQVHTTFPNHLTPVRGNTKQLEIVFVNLIKNAAEAMAILEPKTGSREIWLKAHEVEQWIVLEIRDAGPGIKRTDIGHLFEAYFTTKGVSGTGMGLFLTQQVIKAHGGMIDVKSEEGKGTEFTIRLPKFVSENRTGIHQAA